MTNPLIYIPPVNPKISDTENLYAILASSDPLTISAGYTSSAFFPFIVNTVESVNTPLSVLNVTSTVYSFPVSNVAPASNSLSPSYHSVAVTTASSPVIEAFLPASSFLGAVTSTAAVEIFGVYDSTGKYDGVILTSAAGILNEVETLVLSSTAAYPSVDNVHPEKTKPGTAAGAVILIFLPHWASYAFSGSSSGCESNTALPPQSIITVFSLFCPSITL